MSSAAVSQQCQEGKHTENDTCLCVCKPGPSLVGALKKDWASPNSIALSWQQPEQTALPIIDYEVKYYEKVLKYSAYDSKGRYITSQVEYVMFPVNY